MVEFILFICATVASAICGFNIGRRKRSSGAGAADTAGTGNNGQAEQSVAGLRQTVSDLEQTASGLRNSNQEATEVLNKVEDVLSRIRGVSTDSDSDTDVVK